MHTNCTKAKHTMTTGNKRMRLSHKDNSTFPNPMSQLFSHKRGLSAKLIMKLEDLSYPMTPFISPRILSHINKTSLPRMHLLHISFSCIFHVDISSEEINEYIGNLNFSLYLKSINLPINHHHHPRMQFH